MPATGDLSTPWLLVGLLAGATYRAAGHGALTDRGATVAALTGSSAMTGAVIDLDGQHFPVPAPLVAEPLVVALLLVMLIPATDVAHG